MKLVREHKGVFPLPYTYPFEEDDNESNKWFGRYENSADWTWRYRWADSMNKVRYFGAHASSFKTIGHAITLEEAKKIIGNHWKTLTDEEKAI